MGVGHVAAAEAVRDALIARDASNTAQIVNSYKYAASIVSQVVSNGYIGMVKTIPQMYRFLYSRAERATEVGPFRTWVNQFTATNLRPLLERVRPDAVVCTHAFPCGVMAEYKRQYADAPPVVGVVTDFVVHSFWIHRTIDAYAVATEEMKATLANRGIDRSRVVITGIPIGARFAAEPQREELRRELGLPLDRPAILLMGGGLGIGPLEMMMRSLDRVEGPLSAVVILGRNTRLRERILHVAEGVGYPLRVLNFVDNVADYMHASDLLVSKPGGLTSAEALAARLPMLLVKPLPGQEERNTRYLVERKAALRARNEVDLTRKVADFLSNPERRRTMVSAVAALARPHAAADVAQLITSVCHSAERESHAAVI